MSVPPPPPLPPSTDFMPKMAAARSQLLIDIERSHKLKCVNGNGTQNGINSTNMLNGSGAMNEDPVKSKKDQLQAELSTTLQRRKAKNKFITNVQPPNQNGSNENVVDAPVTNFQNPNYVTPKNSTIRAIRKQTEELRAKSNASDTSSTNTNAIKLESDVDIENLTEIIAKLPQGEAILEEINRSMQKLQQSTKEKQQQPPAEKLMISHGKPNFVIKNCRTFPKPSSSAPLPLNEDTKNIKENYLAAIERLKPVECLPQTHNRTEIPEQKTSDLRKKFETTVHSSSPLLKTIEPKRQPERKITALKIETNPTPKQVDPLQSSSLSPRRAQLFKQQKTILNTQITSPTIHHLPITTGSNSESQKPNFEPKQAVSFSKDLGSTPNRYPDQVKVVVGNGREANGTSNKFMTNVKFVINTNGEVTMQK